MTTEIRVCGDHDRNDIAGCIDGLCRRLEKLTLDPRFEDYGNFVIERDPVLPRGTVLFWGAFRFVSWPFRLTTNDSKLIERLRTAIRANQARPSYQELRAVVKPRKWWRLRA